MLFRRFTLVTDRDHAAERGLDLGAGERGELYCDPLDLPRARTRRCQRLHSFRSFRHDFLRRMLHRDKNFQSNFLAGNFGDLLGVAVAVWLIIETVGGVGPNKLD